MRKGIVAGEPGMFPWPFGRLYGLLGRWLRGRPQHGADEEGPPGPDEGRTGEPDEQPGPAYGRTDQTRFPGREGD